MSDFMSVYEGQPEKPSQSSLLQEAREKLSELEEMLREDGYSDDNIALITVTELKAKLS